MFVVSCEMRLVSQLDSKFLAAPRSAGGATDHQARTEPGDWHLLANQPWLALLAESDHAENIWRRQTQQFYIENCRVMALQPFFQLRAV
jgi:hypothetical protein